MKSTRPRVKYFNLGAWPVFVGFTTCEKAFAAEMRRLGIDNVSFFGRSSANATTHILEKHGTLCFVITAEPFKSHKISCEAYAALIAHEAMHVIQEMQQVLACGKSLGDEAEAYLIQQIVQECLQVAWGSFKVRRTEPMP